MKSTALQLSATATAVLVAASFLLCRGLPPRISVFHYVRLGDQDGVRRCLDWGIGPDCLGSRPTVFTRPSTLFTQAVSFRHFTLARFLIDRGAGVSNASVHFAALAFTEDDPCDRLQFLLDAGLDPNARYPRLDMLLHHAVANGRDAAVTLLLECGARLDLRDSDEFTPLLCAARAGNRRFVVLLLDRGADIEAVDAWGRTPLYEAINSGSSETIRTLLDYGAQVNHRDRWGDTPLHLAARLENVQTVQWLIAAGADVNAADDAGMTPLHEAADLNHPAMARLLLGNGARTDLREHLGRTPLDLAEEFGHRDVVKLLEHPQAAPQEPAQSSRGSLH